MFEFTASAEAKKLLAASASNDKSVAIPAGDKIAKALTLPLRQALFSGDIATNIFQPLDFTDGIPTEFPLDPIAPGTQKDYVAYTMPNQGMVPERNAEGDYVMVPYYQIGNAIDWLKRYSKYSRWDVVGRLLEVFRAGFVKKINDDAWHTLLAAGFDRGVVAFDSDAGSGQFTKRLVSLMKTVMVRGAGGNSATPNRGKMTDLYMSIEASEDIRNWGVDIIDEVTRKQIFDSEAGLMRLFGVNLHPIDELGEGQEYQNFYTGALGGSIQTNDLELVVGLDLAKNDSFVMPMVSPLEVYNDDMARQQRQGLFGFLSLGLGVLDSRRIILGSL